MTKSFENTFNAISIDKTQGMSAQDEWKAPLDTAGNTEIATLPISRSKVAHQSSLCKTGSNNHTTKVKKCFLESQLKNLSKLQVKRASLQVGDA